MQKDMLPESSSSSSSSSHLSSLAGRSGGGGCDGCAGGYAGCAGGCAGCPLLRRLLSPDYHELQDSEEGEDDDRSGGFIASAMPWPTTAVPPLSPRSSFLAYRKAFTTHTAAFAHFASSMCHQSSCDHVVRELRHYWHCQPLAIFIITFIVIAVLGNRGIWAQASWLTIARGAK